jgi:hypothetical protein
MTPCTHPDSYLINTRTGRRRCLSCGYQFTQDGRTRRPTWYALQFRDSATGPDWQTFETFPSHAAARAVLTQAARTWTREHFRIVAVPRTQQLFIVQADYGQGWEDVAASLSAREARADRRSYRENDHYARAVRMIRRREQNPDHPETAGA